MRTYILREQQIVSEPDQLRWAQWFESADRVVAKTTIEGFEISTVFLGIDHNWNGGPPILFETMVFSDYGEISLTQPTTRRYYTWDEAIRGHLEVEELIREWATKKQIFEEVNGD